MTLKRTIAARRFSSVCCPSQTEAATVTELEGLDAEL